MSKSTFGSKLKIDLEIDGMYGFFSTYVVVEFLETRIYETTID